jgi:hypothetical protein
LADYGVESYDIGSGFGHFGIAVEDVRIYLYICSFSVVEIQYYASRCDVGILLSVAKQRYLSISYE